MRTIPVDLILHELATRLAELPDTQHRDLHLAISRGCIRPQALAEEWTHGAGVAQQAARLVRRLDGDDMTAPRLREIAAETRAMEVAVARRLADCALSLLVTQDAEDRAAATLLLDASRLVVGLERTQAGLADLTAEADAVGSFLASWKHDHAPPAGMRLSTAVQRMATSIQNLRASEHDKVSIIAKQEKTIANLKSAALVGVAGVIADALHLEAKPGDSDPATLSRRCVEAIEHLQATVDARAEERDVATRERLKVARECLPPGVDIIACLRDDKPTTYEASNTGEECDTPEAAVRAAWEHHLRLTQSVHERAFKVGDRVKFIGHAGGRMFQHGPVVGGEGTIKDIEDGGACPIWVGDVQCKNGGSDGWWFASAELDLVTPTA